MRPLSLLTNSIVLFILQQLISGWFLIDFFLARDSSTANTLWDSDLQSNDEYLNKIESTVNKLKNKYCTGAPQDQPSFDKVIFIIIDALGSDFIPSVQISKSEKLSGKIPQDAMPFLEDSIRRNKAMGFIAKAATPTVTMPRIKALVSGTIPSFMDIMYNLAPDVSKFDDDNILSIAKSHNKSIVFYGDDTWLSLFDRSVFTRSEVTLSLFASEYTTVDTNVTKNAFPETERDPIDWDLLILHYLGLDHIGHIFGSNNVPMIKTKLKEMDNVIKKIYNDMSTKNHKTLIVVCGDHGMSKEGNHGGDSQLEAYTTQVFMPIKTTLSRIDLHADGELYHQIDLAVTLSLLTGMPIPRMSRGVAIKSLLEGVWHGNKTRLSCSALDNILQLLRLTNIDEFKETLESSELVRLLDRHSIKNNSVLDLSEECFRIAKKIQTNLVATVVRQSNPILVALLLGFVMLMSLINLRKSSIRLLMPLLPAKERLLCLIVTVIPILMQGSTNYIEAEHIFWPPYSAITLALFVFFKCQSNNKLVDDIDPIRAPMLIVTFLITAFWNNLRFLHGGSLLLFTISLLIMFNFSKQTLGLTGPYSILLLVLPSGVYLTKLAEGSNLTYSLLSTANIQILVLITLLVINFMSLWMSAKSNENQPTSIVQRFSTSWMWFAFLLLRSRNSTFLIANVIMEASLNSVANSLRFDPMTRTIIYMHFSQAAFYGQGNSNLFSTIDVKPAFFGQTRYNSLLAIPLVISATMATQIYWYLKLFQRVQGEKETKHMSRSETGSITEGLEVGVKDFMDMRNFLNLGYYIYVCLVLRNHLFIWSVISPKLVYHYITTITLRLTTSIASHIPKTMKIAKNRHIAIN